MLPGLVGANVVFEPSSRDSDRVRKFVTQSIGNNLEGPPEAGI